MDEVGICKEDLDDGPPRERPEFEPLECEDEYSRQMRKAGVVGAWVLFDWHEECTKHGRQQRLRHHGNVEINDCDESYFSDMYKRAFAELFQTVYGHPYTYKSRKAYKQPGVAEGSDDEDDEEDANKGECEDE